MIKYYGNFKIIIDNKMYVEILRDIRFTDIEVEKAVKKLLLTQLKVPKNLVNIVLEKIYESKYEYEPTTKQLIFEISIE